MTERFIEKLKCIRCKREFTIEECEYTCPKCGPLWGTLEVLYDYDRVAQVLTKESLAQNKCSSHWRYLPMMPIIDPSLIQELTVGWTPLYRAGRLEKLWQFPRIRIKDDSRNPTASLKDRASSVAIVKVLEKKAKVVTAASTGNAASSWAAFAALAGVPARIFVPENAPRAKIAQLLLYGAKVIKVRGSYDQAFDLCCRAAEKWGWYNRSTAINPYLGEGKKTTAFEICEQLDWQVPDSVFVSVGDGCIIQGICKGFREFHRIGLIEKIPRIIGVQAAGSAPLVKAWQESTECSFPLQPHTFADSISVGVPRDQIKALRYVRESGGMFLAVEDEEIKEAISTLALNTGIMAEPAGATAVAGMKKAINKYADICGESSVIVITGHGLKDIEGVLQSVSQKPIKIENSLQAVEKIEKMMSMNN